MWPSLIYLPLPTARILETKLYVNHFVVVVVSSLHNVLFICLVLPFIEVNHVECIPL